MSARGGGASSPSAVPPCPTPAPHLPVVSLLDAPPFTRPPAPAPPVRAAIGGPSDMQRLGWPSSAAAATTMKMTPLVHH